MRESILKLLTPSASPQDGDQVDLTHLATDMDLMHCLPKKSQLGQGANVKSSMTHQSRLR